MGCPKQLTGTIPEGNYSRLQIISMSGNLLQGMIPAFILGPDLQGLSLSNNLLSGPIPQDWSAATGLYLVDISLNALTGPFPQSLATTSELTFFAAHDNQLSGPLPDMSNHTTLAYFTIEANQQITGTIPDSFNFLPLEAASFGNTSLTGNLTKLCDTYNTSLLRANCPPRVEW
jgi:hypothetical protein